MNVVDYHIDERLVHGEVAMGWIPQMAIDRVVVIDNYSASSDALKQIFRISIRKGIYLSVLNEEKALANLQADAYGDQKLFILANNFDIYLKMVHSGIPVSEISVGNHGHLSSSEQTFQIARKVRVTAHDIDTICQLHKLNVNCYGRIVASNPDKADLYEEIVRQNLGQ